MGRERNACAEKKHHLCKRPRMASMPSDKDDQEPETGQDVTNQQIVTIYIGSFGGAWASHERTAIPIGMGLKVLHDNSPFITTVTKMFSAALHVRAKLQIRTPASTLCR